MKKLLSILGSIGLVATSSMMVVACGTETQTQSLYSPLKQQTFLVANDIFKNQASSLGNVDAFKDLTDDSDQFFFSYGAEGDNKFIGDYDDSLNGSLNGATWGLLDLLNDRLGLGIKRMAEIPDKDKIEHVNSVGKLEKQIKFAVTPGSSEKLKGITTSDFGFSKKLSGEEISKDIDKDQINKAFQDITNLGNAKYWGNDKDAWKKQIDFLESDNFNDWDYQRWVTLTSPLENENTKVKPSFKLLQQIQIQHVGAIKDDAGKLKIETQISTLQTNYKAIVGSDDGIDNYMNEVFKSINPFNHGAQPYGSALNIDANYIISALDLAVKNESNDIDNIFNNKNGAIIGQYILDNMKDWKDDLTNDKFSLSPLKDKLDQTLYKGKGTSSANDLLSKSIQSAGAKDLDDFLDNFEVYKYKINNPEKDTPKTSYEDESSIDAIRSAVIPDSPDLPDILFSKLSKMKDLVNKEVFTPENNKEDKLLTNFTVYISPKTNETDPAKIWQFSTSGFKYNFPDQAK